MSDEIKATETDDVLEFLNSLPESGKDAGTKTANKGKDEDILGFLDELAAHGNSKPSTPRPDQMTFDRSTIQKPGPPVEASEPQTKESVPQQDIEVNDPITSFTNWWGREGSTRVNSLWGSIAQNASTRAEEAIQFASKQQESINLSKLTNIINEVSENDTSKKTIDSISKNIGFFQSRLNDVINSVINTDELIKINVVYDLKNYNNLEHLIDKNFRRVMSQVEGGIKIGVHNFQHPDDNEDNNIRNLNIFNGKISDGEKLAFANLEAAIKQFEASEKIEKEFKTSNLFIVIQPISINSEVEKEDDTEDDNLITIDAFNKKCFSFTIILKDLTHDLTIVTRSQAYPMKWANWLDGSRVKEEDEEQNEDIDPKEWVKDWIEDGLSLSFGVLAQSYVIKRMGY